MSEQKFAQLREAGRKVVDRANVRKGENLVVTADTRTDMRIIEVIFDAAREIGAVPFSVIVPASGQEDHFTEPPKVFAEALKGADVVIPLVRFSSYASAILETLKQKRVLGFAIAPTVDQVIEWMLDIDYEKIDKISRVVTDLLSDTREFKITSPAGTDVVMMFGGRHIADDPGKVEKTGDENYLPGACICVAPIEESWEGTIVFDALVYPPIGLLSSPIRLEVSHGRIEKIGGKDDAKKLKQWLEEFDDPNMFRMCHIGIGTNPQFKKFTGLKMLDERIYGIVGSGMGTNDIPVFEGNIRAKGHTDGYMNFASVYLDGTPLIQDGKFVHPKLRNV